MAATNLEDANVILGTAVAVLQKHDSILTGLMELRVDIEASQVDPPPDFDLKGFCNGLKDRFELLETFQTRILERVDFDTFQEFRRVVSRGKVENLIISQFIERLDIQDFYLGIYADSNTVPQNLDDDEIYDEAEELDKQGNIGRQYEAAVLRYLDTVNQLDLGDPVVPLIESLGSKIIK